MARNSGSFISLDPEEPVQTCNDRFFFTLISPVCVQCPIWLIFCSSLILCSPVALLKCFMNDFEMVPVSPVITGIIFIFIFHICSIYIVRFAYSKLFSAAALITVLSPEFATSIDTHVPFSLSRIMMSG
jgi:hypothetical protein